MAFTSWKTSLACGQAQRAPFSHLPCPPATRARMSGAKLYTYPAPTGIACAHVMPPRSLPMFMYPVLAEAMAALEQYVLHIHSSRLQPDAKVGHTIGKRHDACHMQAVCQRLCEARPHLKVFHVLDTLVTENVAACGGHTARPYVAWKREEGGASECTVTNGWLNFAFSVRGRATEPLQRFQAVDARVAPGILAHLLGERASELPKVGELERRTRQGKSGPLHPASASFSSGAHLSVPQFAKVAVPEESGSSGGHRGAVAELGVAGRVHTRVQHGSQNLRCGTG